MSFAFQKKRNSNIETLRIVSMVMILCHHMIVQGVSQVVGTNNLKLQICDCFFIFGVNVFILISGYFTIKFTWKKMANLLWICSFYKIFYLIFRSLYLGQDVSLFEWVMKPVGVAFSTGGWFMDIYMLLFYLSPIINKALTCMTKRELINALFVIVAINVLWGWMLGNVVNPNGYTLSQFVMMYFIGYSIKIFTTSSSINLDIRWYVIGLLVFVSINILFLKVSFLVFPENKVFHYNNPFVILGAVCIFMITILSKPFVSKTINFISSSVIAVYLIHHQTGFVEWFMMIVSEAYCNNTFPVFILCYVGLVLSVFVFSVFCDQIRKYIFGLFCKIYEKMEKSYKM